MHFTVHTSTDQLEHVERLAELFTLEWGRIDSFYGFLNGKELPPPLIARDNRGELLGGLAFSTYKHPTLDEPSLWINAVIVIPAHRRHGIASRLIQRAESVTFELGFKTLHVHTHLSSLYQRLGWRLVSTSGQYQVLAAELNLANKM